MELSQHDIKVNGSSLKIGIIVPYFNESIGLELLENCKNELLKQNVPEENIVTIRVAGALEIPFAAKKLIEQEKPNAVITLGATTISSQTRHMMD